MGCDDTGLRLYLSYASQPPIFKRWLLPLCHQALCTKVELAFFSVRGQRAFYILDFVGRIIQHSFQMSLDLRTHLCCCNMFL